MKNSKSNLVELINKNQPNNLDFSFVGETRGKDSYNVLVSISSSGRIVNHRKALNQSIKKASIFSKTEKEAMLKILNELKKYSNANSPNQ